MNINLKNIKLNIDTNNENKNLNVISDSKDVGSPNINLNVEIPVNNLSDIVKKINNIKDDMNGLFVDRKQIINDMFLAVVSKQHMVMIGDPGVGKSALVNDLTSRIEKSNIFSWQLNKTTDPSELFGPFSIKAMENDSFARKTEGTLIDAHIAYLDEVFKANSAVLNSLLQITNERTFNNDGKTITCPLISIFASSNEWGEEEGLEAFTDRFIIKHHIKYLNSRDLKKLLTIKIEKKSSKCNDKLTLKEIEYLHNNLESVTISKKVLTMYIQCISLLKKSDVVISDRKAVQCLDILKASALLDDRLECIASDLKSLTNVLWDGKCNISIVTDIIEEIIFPLKKEYDSIKSDINSIINSYSKINDNVKNKFISSELQNIKSLEVCASNTKATIDVSSTEDIRMFTELIDNIKQFYDYCVEVISTSNFDNLDNFDKQKYIIK